MVFNSARSWCGKMFLFNWILILCKVLRWEAVLPQQWYIFQCWEYTPHQFDFLLKDEGFIDTNREIILQYQAQGSLEKLVQMLGVLVIYKAPMLH